MDRLSDLFDTPKTGAELCAELWPGGQPDAGASQRELPRVPPASGSAGRQHPAPDETMLALVRMLAASDWSAESAIREPLRRSLTAKKRPDHPSFARFASVIGGFALAWMLLVLFLSPPGTSGLPADPASRATAPGARSGYPRAGVPEAAPAATQRVPGATESPTVTVARATAGTPGARSSLWDTAVATATATETRIPSPIATGQMLLGPGRP